MKKDLTKDLKMLKTSFFMYEKTIQQCIERMTESLDENGNKKWTQEDIDEKVENLRYMQNDVKQKFLFYGGNPEELVSIETKKSNIKNKITLKKNKNYITKTQKKPILKNMKNKENTEINVENTNDKKIVNNIYESKSIIPNTWNINDISESFDVIPLPSNGECYANHMSTIPVSYLTANDENMIVSPNLYRDGVILDYLLKAKIKNTEIDPDDLLEGDREAIILWLRATGYGVEYPITVTDKKTGVDFDAVIDLTQIKHKPFVLKGDENGFFDFQLPISKDKIKFRFLTHGDIKQIESIEKEEQINIKKERLTKIIEDLNGFIENDNVLNKDEKLKIYEAKRNLVKWADKLEVDNDLGYTHTLTNRLELSIMSINGNDNRDYISEYVEKMNVRDAVSLRRYIADNEPGLDYAITVERPESLGGGSMPVFLSLDEYVFLNIT